MLFGPLFKAESKNSRDTNRRLMIAPLCPNNTNLFQYLLFATFIRHEVKMGNTLRPPSPKQSAMETGNTPSPSPKRRLPLCRGGGTLKRLSCRSCDGVSRASGHEKTPRSEDRGAGAYYEGASSYRLTPEEILRTPDVRFARTGELGRLNLPLPFWCDDG